jgi:cytochrome P450
MAKDIPEHQRLSDEDVLAQVPTFLVAGHETTSNATTWALYALAMQPHIQNKLRQELSTLQTDTPTMDELNSLQYLDFVVRETLRLHAPVASSVRYALKDNVIPLGEPIVDKNGRTLHEIHMRKGDPIFIPIVAINRSKALWGEDAVEFRPERWESPPKATNNIPGAWGNLLTFLGGPRACIGFRFSLVETKMILFSLVKAFHFELAVPAEKIAKKTAIVQRPYVVGEEGNQMPMYIRPYQHE